MAGAESKEFALLEDLVSLAIDLHELCEPVIYDFDSDKVVDIGKAIRAKVLSIQAHAQSYRAPPRLRGPVPKECTDGVSNAAGEIVELTARLVFDFDQTEIVRHGIKIKGKALEVIRRIELYEKSGKKVKAYRGGRP